MKTSSLALLAGVGVLGYVVFKNKGTALPNGIVPDSTGTYIPWSYGANYGGQASASIANQAFHYLPALLSNGSGLVNAAYNYAGGAGGYSYGGSYAPGYSGGYSYA